jgi:pimeloyl-ACP methyl ester carboxylesterase
MLFLHESGGSSATWQGQLTGLAQTGRCLVLDLPGHGRSEGMGCESVGECSLAVLGFLDALAIRWPVVIVGVCFGAAIAAEIALHAPERVAALVLSGITEGGRASDEVRRETALGEAPETFVNEMLSANAPSRLRNDRLKRWRKTSPLVRHWTLNAQATYPMGRTLNALKVPQVWIAGEEDPVVPPSRLPGLAETAARVRMVSIPRAGCLSMLEQPALFNQAVSAFLDEAQVVSRSFYPENRRPGGYRRRSV